MSSLNKIILIGSIITDPDLRVTTGGESLAKFTLQVDRPERTDGLPTQQDQILVVAWRQLADAIRDFRKGELVLVEGRIVSRSYDDADGVKKYVTEVEAKELKKLTGSPVNVTAESPAAPTISGTKPSVDSFDFSDDTFNAELQFPNGFDAKAMAKELEEDVPF